MSPLNLGYLISIAHHLLQHFQRSKVFRDLNASRNILVWALNPKKHIKYIERQAAIRKAKEAGVKEKEIPKEIKPSWLIEVNSKKNRKH